MTDLDREELKQLLLKCWMTHDGMWFFHILQDSGIEKANQMNKAAIRSLAAIEIERIRNAYGMDRMRTFRDVKTLFDAAFGTLTDDFMGFKYSFPSENVLQWEMTKCFAHAGMTRLGAIDRYECGVLYRVACWFDCLGIEYSLAPQIDRCIMHSIGACRGDFRFALQGVAQGKA
jgi:hypothetical protein